MIVRALAIIALLFLTGCQTTTEGGALQVLDPADLAVAQASAEAHGDPLAAQCWAGLAAYQEAHPLILTDPVGPASAYQKVRNVRRLAQAGIPDEIKMACGGMVIDSAGALRRVLTIGVPGL